MFWAGTGMTTTVGGSLKIGDDGRVHYTYDQLSVVTEASDTGQTVSKYDYGLDQLVSLNNRVEGRSFFHLDALRSTVNLTDGGGSARQSILYDAWGNERERVGTSANKFTFTGYEKDEETSLHYFGARFYDSSVGRFLSADPFLGHDAPVPWAGETRYHRVNSAVLQGYYKTTAKVLRASDATFLERKFAFESLTKDMNKHAERLRQIEQFNASEGLVAVEAQDGTGIQALKRIVPELSIGLQDSQRGSGVTASPTYVDLVPPWLAVLRSDQAGTAQGLNRYAYALSRPLRFTDKWGYYSADVHYGLTKYLALQAGFSESDAETIAQGAERPDQDIRQAVPLGLTNYSLISNKEVKQIARAMVRLWHFPRDPGSDKVVPGSAAARKKIDEATVYGNLNAFGEGLHPFQDSWSHQGKPFFGDFGHATSRRGPGSESDHTHLFPADAMQASRETYLAMVRFLKKNPQYRRGSPEHYRNIESMILGFVKASSKDEKREALDAMGVTMVEEYWEDLSLPEGKDR